MAGHAAAYFRVVAVDFDGTLAEGAVAPATLAALAEARARQIRIVLVTGRIMAELRQDFPQVDDYIDAVVAENGGVLALGQHTRRLATPVSSVVSEALTARGVAHRCGLVLVACATADEPAVSEVIRDHGLDCQLVRNRAELMVLPAGVTKGTGLAAALAVLGLSPHNAIGVGDAENDHSLLDACEVGVAVANAVESLRAHADVVLPERAGDGVAELLAGPVLDGRATLHPRRWRVRLGVDDHGAAVTIPASQLNVVICGGSGTGKSYLAGLVLEELVELGYSVVVCDPEGDHHGLGELQGVYATGGHEARLADPADVVRLLRHGCSSVVADLSHLDPAGQAAYAAGLACEVEAHRAAAGLPQWFALDEAHGPLGRNGEARRLINPSGKGYLLVTWQPADLSADSLAAVDAVVALGSPAPESQFVDLAAAVAGLPRSDLARLLAGPSGRAVLARRDQPHEVIAFTIGPRVTPHLRHLHKYDQRGVEPARQFRFLAGPAAATGAVAANLADPWRPSSPAAMTRCCGITARAMTSPAGWPTSSSIGRSPLASARPRPAWSMAATARWSIRCGWASSARCRNDTFRPPRGLKPGQPQPGHPVRALGPFARVG